MLLSIWITVFTRLQDHQLLYSTHTAWRSVTGIRISPRNRFDNSSKLNVRCNHLHFLPQHRHRIPHNDRIADRSVNGTATSTSCRTTTSRFLIFTPRRLMIVASSTLNRLYSSSVSRNVLESSAIVTESTRMCFTSESSAYYSIGNGPVPSSAARHDGVATIRHHRESRQRPTGILPEFYS